MKPEVKAGLLVLVTAAVLAYMTNRITRTTVTEGKTRVYFTVVKDASGLIPGSKVRVAGLNVGQIREMGLADSQAQITLEIASGTKIHSDASVRLKSVGFLGDKYIDLFPGAPAKPPLPEGSRIPSAGESGTLDELTEQGTKLIRNLNELATTLNADRMNRLMANLERFSGQLAEVEDLGNLVRRLDAVAANLKDITGKIRSGEGSLGKLVTQTETVDRINTTLAGVDRLVEDASSFQVGIDARSAYLSKRTTSRTDINALIRPGPSRYLLIGGTIRPDGVLENVGENGGSTIEGNAVELNAEFSQRLGAAAIRAGLMEGTLGVGLDLYLFADRIRTYGEIYRFRRNNDPQLNLGLEAWIHPPFFAWTGVDFLPSRENRSFFLGAGVGFPVLSLGSTQGTLARKR